MLALLDAFIMVRVRVRKFQDVQAPWGVIVINEILAGISKKQASEYRIVVWPSPPLSQDRRPRSFTCETRDETDADFAAS